jgi:hypothetical protein
MATLTSIRSFMIELMAISIIQISTSADKVTPTSQASHHDAETSGVIALEQPRSSVDHSRISPVQEIDQDHVPIPDPEPQLEAGKEKKEEKEQKIETLSEAQIRTLFAGAPHFSISETESRCTPTVSYPWDVGNSTQHGKDSVDIVEPAFMAATLHKHVPKVQDTPDDTRQYNGYEVGVVEMPSMLSAQGVEPGTVSFCHFLELPKSDSLAIDLEQSHSNQEILDMSKNKEMMQKNPERLGIRPVELNLIYDRFVEFQDLYEAFHDSPEPMTILNNQSSEDLYANLFTKFLTPPGYNDATEDPTGLETQINALLGVLRLQGVWYDFSLVEWRIRLGQVLWSEPELTPEHETQPLWTEREILLLQTTLACELLLRLDAFTNADAADAEIRLRIDPKHVEGFYQTKTRKIDWDLVLARTFLNNITIIRGSDKQASLSSQPRGFMSLLGRAAHAEPPQSDFILLPQHQDQQLSGLLQFAKSIQWPTIDTVYKLGIQTDSEPGSQPSSPNGRPLEAATPSGISVYGTPLQTPFSPNHQLDNYFGHIGKPILNRNNSRALRMPLSPTSTLSGNGSTLENVGGWLSRSYLTGLILPGEAISHFLMSTLLENDSSAIAGLGESANLYGGFTFEGRTFWSKSSVVGRILACVQGSAECMGWISCPKLPEEPVDRWYSIYSELIPYENRLRVRDASDLVTQDSAIVPEDAQSSVRSEDFVLPSDLDSSPTTSLIFSHWDLTPINIDLIDDATLAGPPTESDIHAASMTFVSDDQAVSHTFTLTYDVHFVTCWPCTTAAAAPNPSANLPKILRRSITGNVSRSSSKGSTAHLRRNSHGFEPLLSHPPDASDIAPKRMYDVTNAQDVEAPATNIKPMNAHLLHKTYSHKVVPVSDVLDPDFLLPFALHTSKSSERLLALSRSQDSDTDTIKNDKKSVLVLDARASSDLELLARAWCADKGLHAIISRVGRTCLACSIREARGLGINIVIRV